MEASELAAALIKYGSHTDECELVTRGRMSYIAQLTMEQVVGYPQCTCGWKELKKELEDGNVVPN